MKIAFFTEGYEPFVNGVTVTVRRLREGLERRGHQVFIITPACRGREQRDPHVICLPSVQYSDTIYPVVRPFCRIRQLFEELGVDLIHTHHPFTTGRLAVRMARRFELPMLYTFHTMMTEYTDYLPFGASALRWGVMEIVRHHAAHADRVLASTQVVRDFLIEEGVEAPITVVPLPVPPMRPTPGGRERVRARFGIPAGMPVLLYAGRLSPEKRLDFLLRALERLQPRDAFRLLLLGEGPCGEELREQASVPGLRDRVIFGGLIPPSEMPDHYAAADMFVFPSTSDTLGLVLVEAMSVGLPCVAVDRWGPGELITNGVDGLLTPFDETAFAGAIRRLLADEGLRRHLGYAATRRARDFAPAAAVNRLEEVYREVIGWPTRRTQGVVPRRGLGMPAETSPWAAGTESRTR